MNYRYIPSYYYPEQKEIVAEEVAPVVEPVPPVVEEVDDTLTAREPEPVVHREPVYSSYFDEEQVPLAYRMQYTISAPSVAVQPVVQAVAQPVVEEKVPVVEKVPLAPIVEAPIAEAAPVAAAKDLPRTYTVYKNQEESSNYAWAEEASEGQVYPTYTHTPYQSRGQEESTYVGFKNDVYAAYGKPSVPAIYNTTPSAPVVTTAVQAVASLECLTAEEGPAFGAAMVPLESLAAPRSRFVTQVKAAPLPQQSQTPSMDYGSVEGNAFRPVVMPHSEYQYGGLNDLVSCVHV